MNKQMLIFGIVGIIAAGVHFILVILLVHWLHWLPLVANILAFLIAFQVSYQGHSLWTFSWQTFDQKTALRRFFIVAAGSFGLNEALFALLLHVFDWPYPYALILVLLVVPPLTFIVSKLWAFQRGMHNANY